MHQVISFCSATIAKRVMYAIIMTGMELAHHREPQYNNEKSPH